MNKKKIKLKVGDIISFELEEQKYGFARVIAKVSLGDAICVFNYFSNDINDYEKAIQHPLLFDPVILDTHSLFWRRLEGNWSLIKRDNKYIYEDKSKYKYKYGVKGSYKLIDLNNNTYTDISQEVAEKYPDYISYGDYGIKRRILFLLEKLQSNESEKSEFET